MNIESLSKEEYGDDYNSAVLEQWKTCVEMANSNAEKRISSNNVFITLNSALLAIISFSLDYKSILLSVVGIVLCILWKKSIDNYRRLGKMKYLIIDEMEKKLPFTPFLCEWKELKNNPKYSTLTKTEIYMPRIFIALFSLAILLPIVIRIIQ